MRRAEAAVGEMGEEEGRRVPARGVSDVSALLMRYSISSQQLGCILLVDRDRRSTLCVMPVLFRRLEKRCSKWRCGLVSPLLAGEAVRRLPILSYINRCWTDLFDRWRDAGVGHPWLVGHTASVQQARGS